MTPPVGTAKAKPKAKPTFGDSPFAKVQREVHQAYDLRRPIIRKLEKHFGARVVTMFTSFQRLESQITDDDAEMLESVLSAEHEKGGKLVLVLNSAGGQALAAERIVNVCREYSDHQFEVAVPHMAKSAATMICFGADAIHMSKTAELGPVDPQVPMRDDIENPPWISAEEYVRSYTELLEVASSGRKKRIEPYLQQLNRYDARYIEQLRSAQRLSADISRGLLKSGMMAKQTEKVIEKKIEVFLTQAKTSAHGRMINHSAAAACGLVVKIIDLRSDLWNDLWDLFVRSDWSVSHTCSKLIESGTSSVFA
jgi:ATP-dependent protease ClpP protease subunit